MSTCTYDPATQTTTEAQKPAKKPSGPTPAKKSIHPKTVKKLSALNAAAKVLSETDGPLSARQMIEAMAGKGYWTSPTGKTPSATLYAAILRQIQTKGDDALFVKSGPGLFALRK